MHWSIVGVIVIAALAITGCAASAELPQASGPAVADEAPDFMIEVVQKLGPVPPRPVYTPDEEEQARVQHADMSWAHVLAQFPAAEQPAVEFDRYINSVVDSSTTQMACLDELGFETVPGHTADGKVAGFEFVMKPGQEQAAAIASWQCNTRFPFRPSPPLTPDELGYLYDYFVEFQVPCLEAEGHQQLPPPARESFIQQWPQQNWYPTPRLELLDDPEWESLRKACPSAPRGFGPG